MDGKLIQVRGGSCGDGATCPAAHLTPRGTLNIIGRPVTDPAELAQMAIGPGEIAIEVPGTLFPEAAADADH